MDAVSLLKLLNEEHSRTRLPDNLQRGDCRTDPEVSRSTVAFKLPSTRPAPGDTPPDRTETVILERDPGAPGDGGSDPPDVQSRRTAPITLGGVIRDISNSSRVSGRGA